MIIIFSSRLYQVKSCHQDSKVLAQHPSQHLQIDPVLFAEQLHGALSQNNYWYCNYIKPRAPVAKKYAAFWGLKTSEGLVITTY